MPKHILLLISILTLSISHKIYAQGSLQFFQSRHYNCDIIVPPSIQTKIVDTIIVPAGHVLKIENDFLARYNVPNRTANDPLDIQYGSQGIIELVGANLGVGTIISRYYGVSEKSGGFPVWLNEGTYYLRLNHGLDLNSSRFFHYSVHGILFKIQ
jgi:hypothetical protein